MSSFHAFSLEVARLETRQLLAGPSEEYSGMSTTESETPLSTIAETYCAVTSRMILDYPHCIEIKSDNHFTSISYGLVQLEWVHEQNQYSSIENEPNDNGVSDNAIGFESAPENEFNKFLEDLHERDHKSTTWATWLLRLPFTSGLAGAAKNVITSTAYLLHFSIQADYRPLSNVRPLIIEKIPLLIVLLRTLGNVVDSITASLNSADIYDKKLTNAYALDELARINPENLNTTEQAALAVAKYYYAPQEVGHWTFSSKKTTSHLLGTEAIAMLSINWLKWHRVYWQHDSIDVSEGVVQCISASTNSLLMLATAMIADPKIDTLFKSWDTQMIATQYDTQASEHEDVRLDEVSSIVYRAQPLVVLNTIETFFTLARVPALGYATAEIAYKLFRGPDAYLHYSQVAHRTIYFISFGLALCKIAAPDVLKWLPFLPLPEWLNPNGSSTEEEQWALNTLIDGLRIDFQNSNALCKETPSKCDIETMFGPSVEYLKAFKIPTDVIENIAKAPHNPYAKDVLTRHLNLT